jgi:YidC/Oxa1 family membrane protein insertase
MSNEKRFVLFILLMLFWMMGFPYVMRFLGLNPPPKKPPAPAVAAGEAGPKAEPPGAAKEPAKDALAKGQEPAKTGGPEKGKAEAPAAAAAAEPTQPEVAPFQASELVLGSETDTSPGGYRLRVQLTQTGAGVESLSSSRFDAEYEDGVAVKRPLQIIKRDNKAPASLTLMLNAAADAVAPAVPPGEDAVIPAREARDWLDSVNWEVVPDDQGRIRRRISVTDPATQAVVEGEAIVFRTKARNGVVVTKTYRLGKNIDGLEMELRFESPGQARQVVYDLIGPHGIPIEGEWYTGTFRDLFFAPVEQGEIKKPETYTADTVVKKPPDNTALPLAFAGVENQYFAALLEPVPIPTRQEDRWDARAVAQIVHRNEEALQKSDIGFVITSKPITVDPGHPVVHNYRVFAGPKIADALRPYRAEGLASYRRSWSIPFAVEIGRYIITPTLDMTYRLTESVAHVFGGKKGNYGIAIILLTMLVRGLMFPLGRKQAIAAQKMQALQPYMKEIQEKYKDDKERLTKETFALYKKYGVNPMGGCLPALIQLPIFVGLWQAINTSVPLRHATFLWIRDLAAPDMMFRFPFEVPFLGWWFNLLPFLVIALMLVQTKLFSPPPTTPEAEASQKMMKYMMIFMGVMFYKVPSGLGIYFITSSLWAVGERLLLPKVTHTELTPVGASEDEEMGEEKAALSAARGSNGDGRGPRGGKGPSGDNGLEGKRQGRFAQFWERVLEEAQKDKTYRKAIEERESRGRDKDKGDPRPRPRRR